MKMLPEKLEGNARCRKCRENEQVDRFLRTPKDEVTHFGPFDVLCVQREAEHSMLLACHRHGLWERLVLQRILDFVRVPFVTSHSGMHYCELCDKTFSDLAVKQGQQVRMSIPDTQADWSGCPGLRLTFNTGDTYTVAELLKIDTAARWFFKVLKPIGKERVKHQGSGAHDMRFGAFWAPLDASAQGEQPSQLLEHLQGTAHKTHEQAIGSGSILLVSHAAIKLASKLGEPPRTTMSRFRVGLGLTSRFCEASHVERAAKLERVRNLDIPVKFLRETLSWMQDFLWIAPEELREVEDKYKKRKSRCSRKG